MNVLKALADEIWKMFAADLALTVTALIVIALAALALKTGYLERDLAPPFVAAGVLVALLIGVGRGAKKT